MSAASTDSLPLSIRTGRRANPHFEQPPEGFPPYLFEPVWSWICKHLDEIADFERIQLTFRLEDPLDLDNWPDSAFEDLYSRAKDDDDLVLDLLDYFVRKGESIESQAGALNDILKRGGSAWEVTMIAGDRRLHRRTIGPIADAIQSVGDTSTRAETHLKLSWAKVKGRNPDPTGGYREAVRAVEVAAKPVVSPNNASTTLGTIIANLKDKPEKWDTSLYGGIALVIAESESLWKGQFDRHGTDDESVPISVSLQEADIAFHQALYLVQLFTSPGIWRRRSPANHPAA